MEKNKEIPAPGDGRTWYRLKAANGRMRILELTIDCMLSSGIYAGTDAVTGEKEVTTADKLYLSRDECIHGSSCFCLCRDQDGASSVEEVVVTGSYGNGIRTATAVRTGKEYRVSAGELCATEEACIRKSFREIMEGRCAVSPKGRALAAKYWKEDGSRECWCCDDHTGAMSAERCRVVSVEGGMATVEPIEHKGRLITVPEEKLYPTERECREAMELEASPEVAAIAEGLKSAEDLVRFAWEHGLQSTGNDEAARTAFRIRVRQILGAELE